MLDNSNSFTGASGGPTTITGGAIETHYTSPLGTGAVTLTNTTWNATTNNQTSAGTVTLSGAVNINTSTNLNLSGGITGGGTLNKGARVRSKLAELAAIPARSPLRRGPCNWTA